MAVSITKIEGLTNTNLDLTNKNGDITDQFANKGLDA
jgi:hypothetical protein